MTFDFRYLGFCEWEEETNKHSCQCLEPAVAKVWWDDEQKDSMLVCKKHLEELEKFEEFGNR